MALIDVYISGTGSRLGSTHVSIKEVGDRFHLTSAQLQSLQRKCGPSRLFKCADNESIEDCALDACRNAMRTAGISADDVSGVYASTGGPVSEYVLPDLSRTLALKLGLGDVDTVGMLHLLK